MCGEKAAQVWQFDRLPLLLLDKCWSPVSSFPLLSSVEAVAETENIEEDKVERRKGGKRRKRLKRGESEGFPPVNTEAGAASVSRHVLGRAKPQSLPQAPGRLCSTASLQPAWLWIRPCRKYKESQRKSFASQHVPAQATPQSLSQAKRKLCSTFTVSLTPVWICIQLCRQHWGGTLLRNTSPLCPWTGQASVNAWDCAGTGMLRSSIIFSSNIVIKARCTFKKTWADPFTRAFAKHLFQVNFLKLLLSTSTKSTSANIHQGSSAGLWTLELHHSVWGERGEAYTQINKRFGKTGRYQTEQRGGNSEWWWCR